MNELVSIIVPIYNVESYLKKCVCSIVEQTYTNLEIILVDDGSTDNSGIIADQISKKDCRIKVYHKKNGGLSDARNFGMKQAHGDFIEFVDSDDYVSPEIIQHQLFLIKKYDAEIAIIDPIHIFENDKKKFVKSSKIIEYDTQDAIVEMLYQRSFLVSAWGKLFRNSLFYQIEFPKGKLFEDSAIMYKVFENAKKIIYSNAKYYAYVHRKNSITTQSFSKKDLDILPITKTIENHYNSNNVILKAAKSYRMSACLRILLNAPKSGKYDLAINECNKYFKNNWRDVYKDKNIRLKEKYAIFLYAYFKPIIPFIYRHVDRWK